MSNYEHQCGYCGGQVAPSTAPVVDEVRGHRVTIRDLLHGVCAGCGEEYFEGESLAKLDAEYSRQVRAAEGLLQPAEIRAIRESLGMTQARFEQLLGVGPKTVVRWESGTVYQSKAVDRLIRLVGAVPEAAVYLRELGTPQKPVRA